MRDPPESRRQQVIDVAQMLVVGVGLLPAVGQPATTAAGTAAFAGLLASF